MYPARFKSHHDAARRIKEAYTLEQSKSEYLWELLGKESESRRVIYIHVPFCNKICSFCPFHRPDQLKRREYHHYLIGEIRRIREHPYFNAPVDAVNFGGGTPTSLLPEQMHMILKELKQSFRIRTDAEISVESSVSELTDEMLCVLREGGVNRLSLGVQTFRDEARKLLGRRGSGEKAALRIESAIRSGIVNTNIDLIYHYPGQTLAQLREDLSVIKTLRIAGLSFYALMLHEQTPLYRKLSAEEQRSMGDAAQEYLLFSEILRQLQPDGFRPLEFTKLVRDGIDRYDYMKIRHNGGSCVAIGHGAGGNLENYFYHNSASIPKLSQELPISSAGRIVRPEYRIIDAFIYDLQTGGTDLAFYAVRLGIDLETVLSSQLRRLESAGLIAMRGSRITFTEEGIFWGNNIIDEMLGVIVEASRFFQSNIAAQTAKT